MSSDDSPRAGGPLLELDGVDKRFEDTHALRDVSLEVAAGETAVLIGSSGSGKSTVLRLIIGLLSPDAGRVRFDGAAVDCGDAAPHRKRIGYVIQEGGLFAHLSARDNVTLLARHLGWEPSRIEQRVGELSQLVQLPADALARFPVQLSGGQRQRVSLMRALMMDPDVLLLDEPLGALDPITRAELSRDLKDIFRSLGKTVLMVTHDVGEAGFFSDWVALMSEGQVVQRGTLPELVERPATPFVERFIAAQRGPLSGGAA